MDILVIFHAGLCNATLEHWVTSCFGRSRLCLDALVEIMNIEAPVRRVLPVFYEVEPCVVRHQKRASPYDLSAVEGSTREDRKRCGNALHQLSHLKGFEWATIQMIVKQVETYLGHVV
ncbi:hypothetical protein KP509_15G015800 [Ceratopteris richardii]|uniref:Uncharacterized protein n=1 Tax=Ceratopteris richardii TaxID=49495 RepID=A0A8T2T5J6_CERRI|nr:hypothetical protein KP509_15G015800 [Ceratopteris richardii]